MKDAGIIEYLGVFVWLVLMPVLGIVGYMHGLSWLFYICGGIHLLTERTSADTGVRIPMS